MILRQHRSPGSPASYSRLRVRIPVFVLLFSAMVAIGASVIELFIAYEREVALIEARVKQLGVSSAGVLAVSIWKLDEEQVRLQLNNMLQIPDMRYITIESSDLGEIVAGTLPQHDSITQIYPLMHYSAKDQIQVGSLHIVASLDDVYTRLWSRGLLIMSAEIIKTFLVSIFILLLIHFLVARHLTRMATYARNLNIASLNEELKLESRGKHHKNDELDDLVTAINAMLADLKLAHYQLQNSHNTLEENVAERTKELELAKDIAEKASQAKSEFLATINHELRTPLTSILGGLGLVTEGAMGEIPAKMSSPLNIAYRNSKRLLLLVNDVLDIAKIEAGHLTLECATIKLELFLTKAMELNQAYAESFEVKICLAPCPQDLSIYADENRLLQVMNNLISNAIKFTTAGDEIEVSVKQLAEFIEICVSDHGQGIPDELRDRIFEKFTQADSSNTRTAGGTGLGLAISKSIVELHGGNICFDSTIGQGTSFYVRIKKQMEP